MILSTGNFSVAWNCK